MRRTIAELRTMLKQIAKTSGALVTRTRATTENEIGRYAVQAFADMERDYPPLQHSDEAHKQSTRQKIADKARAQRTAVAGKLRYELETAIEPFERDVLDTEQALLADVGLNFPEALDGLDNGRMIDLGIYRALRTPPIEAMPASELLTTGRRAIAARHLATSRVDWELIEARLSRTNGIAKSEQDLPAVTQLSTLRDWLRDERIPVDADFDGMREAIAAAKRAIGNASMVNIPSINADQAGLDLQRLIQEAEAEHEAAGAGA